MSALKLCPFCGGEPKLGDDVDDAGCRIFALYCGSCFWTATWVESTSEAAHLWGVDADATASRIRAQRMRDIVREQWRCMVAVRMVVDDALDDDGGATPPQSATEERIASETLAPLFPSAAEIVGGEP